MKPKPHELVEQALQIEGYKASLARDLRDTATLINCAEMGSPAQTFATEEIEAIRAGAVTSLFVVSEILEHGRSSVGCETLADVAKHIATCAAAVHKICTIDKE